MKCKHCNFILKTFDKAENLSKKEYWLMTEVFVYLHGSDSCELKSFHKYQHVEKFGTEEVENIELGETYVFPKIDGTNGSLWMDNGLLCAGSRNRQLSLESDNAGFFAWASEQESIKNYFAENPTHRLFGEWLVPQKFPHNVKRVRRLSF